MTHDNLNYRNTKNIDYVFQNSIKISKHVLDNKIHPLRVYCSIINALSVLKCP